jgi:iron complex outermembrane recepter protein
MTITRNIGRPKHRLNIAVNSALATLMGLSAGISAQDGQNGGKYSLVLEEVIVTAQKREEGSMSVPISVDAFSTQDLINTGATDIGQIDDYMPGVEIDSNQSTQTSITIRGVSSPTISTAQDPSIATFYDGSYLPRAATAIPLVDIERVEVLKGPQGTLFGRNASVGVINIVPNKPSDEFEGFAKARLGNHDLVRLEGMVNTPINDELAFRGAVFSDEREGIVNNEGIGKDLKEEDFKFGRMAFAWQPNIDTRVQFATDYEDRDSAPSYSIGVNPFSVSTDPFSGSTANDVIDRTEEREMWGSSIQVDHDFNDAWSVFGIISYREWETWNLQDEDGTDDPRRYFDSNNIEDSDIWYTEVRFNFTDGPLNVIFGGNYSTEDVYQNTTIGIMADSYMQFVSNGLLPVFGVEADNINHLWDLYPDAPDDFWMDLTTLATAGEGKPTAVLPPDFAGDLFIENLENTGEFVNWGFYVDATYDITDTIRVAGGLRYSYDDKEFTWQTEEPDIDWPVNIQTLNYDPAQTGAPPEEWYNIFKDDEDWDDVTGRIVIDWEFMDGVMTYASFGTGFKSGGWDGNQFSAVATGPFDPEEMESYEWGLKGDFFDNRLRIEAALFYQELTGKQNQRSTRDCASPIDCSNDQTAAPTIVSSDEDTEGLELTARWSVTDSLRLTALSTTRDVDVVDDFYYDGQGTLRGGESTSSTDLDYTLILDWSPQVPTGYLLVHVDYIYNEADDDSNAEDYASGRWYFQPRKDLNARIAWSNDNDTIEVAIWGANILDRERASNPGGYVADALDAYKTGIEDPRTYGVDLKYSF